VQAVRVNHSSGYERLDDAALETVRDYWHYQVPERPDKPKVIWFTTKITFVLE
jgi:TonB family protein